MKDVSQVGRIWSPIWMAKYLKTAESIYAANTGKEEAEKDEKIGNAEDAVNIVRHCTMVSTML